MSRCRRQNKCRVVSDSHPRPMRTSLFGCGLDMFKRPLSPSPDGGAPLPPPLYSISFRAAKKQSLRAPRSFVDASDVLWMNRMRSSVHPHPVSRVSSLQPGNFQGGFEK